MTAAVWTLIGLLVVSQGVLLTTLLQLRTELKGEIRDLRTELKDEIHGLRTEVREGFAAVNGRLEAHIDRHAS